MPLKIIIDNVIDKQPLPAWLAWIHIFSAGNNRMQLAAAAALTLIVITIVGAIAGYLNSYFTESTAQYVANDVRLQVYHHLERLSFGYYDTHQVEKILSTITADVSTMQDFVSNTLLSILIDAMTILGILALMFYINWSFALIAVAVTPSFNFCFPFKAGSKKISARSAAG